MVASRPLCLGFVARARTSQLGHYPNFWSCVRRFERESVGAIRLSDVVRPDETDPPALGSLMTITLLKPRSPPHSVCPCACGGSWQGRAPVCFGASRRGRRPSRRQLADRAVWPAWSQQEGRRRTLHASAHQSPTLAPPRGPLGAPSPPSPVSATRLPAEPHEARLPPAFGASECRETRVSLSSGVAEHKEMRVSRRFPPPGAMKRAYLGVPALRNAKMPAVSRV